MKITVLMGGASSERNVSLASGLRIAEALRSKGHKVTGFDPARGPISAGMERELAEGPVGTEPPSLEALAKTTGGSFLPALERVPEIAEADVVFLALHGGQGEDGTLQALLVVVKPSKQGSTVGLTVVKTREQYGAAIEEAFRYDDEVMVEQFIAGRELTVGVLGDRVFPVGEIKPKHEIYDYECKYTAGMATEEFPAQLSPEQTSRVQRQALAAFRALKLGGCARIDFRLSGPDDGERGGEFYCLEANTLPGMTELSLIPQGAAAMGMSFADLCEEIVRLAKK